MTSPRRRGRGKPGQVSYRDRRKQLTLVKHGKASSYHPYRTVEEACAAAGLP